MKNHTAKIAEKCGERRGRKSNLFFILMNMITVIYADSAATIVAPISQLSGGTTKSLPFAIPVPTDYYLVRHPVMKTTNMYVHKDDLVPWQKKIHAEKGEQMFSMPYFLFENSSTVSFDSKTKKFSTERFGAECGNETGTFYRKKTLVGSHHVCEIIGKLGVPEVPQNDIYVHIIYVDMNYEGWVWTAMYVITQPEEKAYQVPQIWLDIRTALSAQTTIPATKALQVRHFRPIFSDDAEFPEDVMANDRSYISMETIEMLRKGKITIKELLSNPQNIASDILTFKEEQNLKLTKGRDIRFDRILNFNLILPSADKNMADGTHKMYGDRFFVTVLGLGNRIVFSIIKHEPESDGKKDISQNRDEISHDLYYRLLRTYAKQRTDKFRKYHKFM